MMSRCALCGLRVRDSNTLQDSAPKFNFVEEQHVLVRIQGDS